VDDRRGVAVAAGVVDVVVDRMVVGGDFLERLRFDDREGGRIELVRAGGGWLGHGRCSLRGNAMG
jgi:hypothetical protein